MVFSWEYRVEEQVRCMEVLTARLGRSWCSASAMLKLDGTVLACMQGAHLDVRDQAAQPRS